MKQAPVTCLCIFAMFVKAVCACVCLYGVNSNRLVYILNWYTFVMNSTAIHYREIVADTGDLDFEDNCGYRRSGEREIVDFGTNMTS